MQSIIGFDHLDIFTAYAAFKGNIGFELSMIADFDIDDVSSSGTLFAVWSVLAAERACLSTICHSPSVCHAIHVLLLLTGADCEAVQQSAIRCGQPDDQHQ